MARGSGIVKIVPAKFLMGLFWGHTCRGVNKFGFLHLELSVLKLFGKNLIIGVLFFKKAFC